MAQEKVQETVQERKLPKKRNPLLAPDHTPDPVELASSRRLGQTVLAVKPGQVNTSNATKPENLGMFDFAHLKAPLPENLRNSEIFTPQEKQLPPDAYFLMRRSTDGYVSATGMFKVSFPWAKHAEENAEREYLKTLSTTSEDEVAGNIWIPETYALKLAEDYGIIPWIKALLDDSPIQDEKKSIAPPPKFQFSANHGKPVLPPPGATPARSRGRPRAASPSKINGKPLSPRKPRQAKTANEANAVHKREVSGPLQVASDAAASVADTESVVDSRSVDEEKEAKVTIEVDSAVGVNGDTETTHTNVKVEMSMGTAELPLPESTEEMIAIAKEMVEEARKLEGESSGRVTKRKAEVLEDEDEDEDEQESSEFPPAKRAKVLEQRLQRQTIRTRALLGVAATLAIGAIIPYVIGG